MCFFLFWFVAKIGEIIYNSKFLNIFFCFSCYFLSSWFWMVTIYRIQAERLKNKKITQQKSISNE